MAQFYKVLKADPLGEPWTPNFPDAKPIQNYWCQVEGEEWDVSIGKQVPGTVTPGESVYGDLLKAKSQKGTDYWKFKSQKVPEGVQRPASTPAQAQAQAATTPVGDGVPGWAVPLYNMVEYIYKEMKKMDTDAEPEPPVEKPAEVEQVAGEPLDEETKQTLDNIFGQPETPEDIPADEGDEEPQEPADPAEEES